MPRIGLLSDTHGRAAITRRAVALLVERGAQVLIHLDDVGSEGVLDELVAQDEQGRAIPCHLVLGNTDGDAARLARYAGFLGLTVDHPVGRLRLDEGELVFTHGDDPHVLRQAIVDGVKYFCQGHTHLATDRVEGKTRIINPGALCRAKVHTVALLDTGSDEVTFVTVGE